MKRTSKAIIVLAILTWARARSAKAECNYGRYVSQEQTQLTIGCYTQPPEQARDFSLLVYGCETGDFKFFANDVGAVYKTCDPNGWAEKCNGCIKTSAYNCDNPSCSTSLPPKQPNSCDGKEKNGSGQVDQGCGNDENKCKSPDSDPFPVRFSSGRVESKEITGFAAPTISEIPFEYRLQYNSTTNTTAARARWVNGVKQTQPSIQLPDEDFHFMGYGWRDNFSQYLSFASTTQTSNIAWVQSDSMITFPTIGVSFSDRYELLDRGTAVPAGEGRWVVRTRDPSSVMKIWTFDEVLFTTASGSGRRGRLRRHAAVNSTTDFIGYYGYNVNYSPNGHISNVIDTLGRQFDFVYREETSVWAPPTPPVVASRKLEKIRYKSSAAGTAVDVVSLTYRSEQLDRIERPGLPGYIRFLYWNPPAACINCSNLLTDVIYPGEIGTTTPGTAAPLQTGEVVTEHHDYETSTTGTRPRALRSRGIGRSFGYVYTSDPQNNPLNTQFDLNIDLGACTGASLESDCYQIAVGGDGRKHPVQTRQADGALGLNTQQQYIGSTGSSSGGGGGGGGASSDTTYTNSRSYDAKGHRASTTDEAGVKTSYGLDSKGRNRCIVRGDNDDFAFATPGSPDTSACAGPATAQIIRVDYAATTITKTTTSLIGGSGANSVEVTTINAVGLPTQVTTTAWTRNIAGALVSEVHTSTTVYDSLFRVIETNGPLPDATHLDKITMAYYNVGDATLTSFPHNLGQLKSVTRFVGNSTTNYTLTTTYGEYDLFGVAQIVTGPGGDGMRYTPSVDRLTWVAAAAVNGTATTTKSTITLNSNGSVRSVVDADNICMTYEYSDVTGYLGTPVKIKRGNATGGGCGVVPINVTTGEVEIHTYASGEPDRLTSIERRMGGVLQFSYGGFVYGTDRKVVAASTLDSTLPFTFNYTDVLPSGAAAPGGAAPGAWKSTNTSDAFARPASLYRFLNATDKQQYNFSYATNFTPAPTTMTRGLNGAVASTTTFEYDDFGRLVTSVVPEAGVPGSPLPTRFEYDLAGNLTKKRMAAGNAAQKTDQFTNDSLGRKVFVDNNIEVPVNCATAANGTPIQDEEYEYGTAAGSSKGRLTVARSLLQCSGGVVVSRQRSFSYTTIGQLSGTSYTTKTGTTSSPSVSSNLSYSTAGRLAGYGSPIGGQGPASTPYTLSPNSGQVTAISTLLTGVTYRAFGAVTGYDGNFSQPVTGGTRKLRMTASYRSDDALSTITWSAVPATGTPNPKPELYMDQSFGYNASGLVQVRSDAADANASRYYGYDALLRLTCEARGTSSAGCAANSTNLVSLLTYNDGASATAPPDTRSTAVIKHNVGTNPYVSTGLDTLSYSSGSGRIVGISSTNGQNMVFGYDGLGRRTFEYNDTEPVKSRRDYIYLPNGQLGSIAGKNDANAAWSVAMRYDEMGRPLTIAYAGAAGGDTMELFWDHADRLIGTLITHPTPVAGVTTVGWDYHYIGRTLVMASRMLVKPPVPPATAITVVRTLYWVVSDERGLPHRLLDQQGVEAWRATWDASGWRTISTQAAEMDWMPFGLPGQIILRDTEAPGILEGKRPPIALNQWRAYDPLTGSFLQPDGMDQIGRRDPEGYAYARSSPVAVSDPSGQAVTFPTRPKVVGGYNFHGACDITAVLRILEATNVAIQTIDKCAKGWCNADKAKREWTKALQNVEYYCPRQVSAGGSPIFDQKIKNGSLSDATTTVLPETRSITELYPVTEGFSINCLAATLAHERLHAASTRLYVGDLQGFPLRSYPGLVADLPLDEEFVDSETSECFDCIGTGAVRYSGDPTFSLWDFFK